MGFFEPCDRIVPSLEFFWRNHLRDKSELEGEVVDEAAPVKEENDAGPDPTINQKARTLELRGTKIVFSEKTNQTKTTN